MGKRRFLRIRILFRLNMGYGRSILAGVCRYARSRRDWLLESDMCSTESLARLSSDPPDGAVVDAAWNQLPRLPERIALISLSQTEQSPWQVMPDNQAVGALAAGHLLESGLHHFAALNVGLSLACRERVNGFLQTIRQAGHEAAELPADVRVTETSLYDFADEAQALAALASVPSFAGLFVHREDIAVATLRLLRRAGRSSPEDVALICGRDDELLCTAWTPTISAVRIPAERIGYEAAVRLAQRLEGAGPPDRALRLRPAGLAIRQSTDVLAYGNRTVVRAIRFLRMHSHEAIRIADAVQALEVDRRALERGFRKHLGQTPAAYLRRLRLNRAEDLICNTPLPLEEIASRCGFASATRMSEAMRRERGHRPGALRAESRSSR